MLRNTQTPQVQLLREAGSTRDQVIVGDIVLLEILQGMQSNTRAAAMERWLLAFVIMPMLDVGLAVRAAGHYRTLRQRGVTIRKTADLIIGTFCLDRALPLLHDDRDFDAMERHLGLAVLRA